MFPYKIEDYEKFYKRVLDTFLIFCHNFVAAFILYLLISGLAVVQGKVEEKQIEKKQQCSEGSTVAE